MPVYMIASIEVLDREKYSEYVARVPATVEKYGGRYLVRGGRVTTLNGKWHPERVIVLEFPSAEKLQRWFNSPEYSAIMPIRLRSTNSNVIMVEGYSSQNDAVKE